MTRIIIFMIAILVHGRLVEWTARLDFLWQLQASQEKKDMDVLQESNKRILHNLLPAHVASHFLDNQFRSNMVNIYFFNLLFFLVFLFFFWMSLQRFILILLRAKKHFFTSIKYLNIFFDFLLFLSEVCLNLTFKHTSNYFSTITTNHHQQNDTVKQWRRTLTFIVCT